MSNLTFGEALKVMFVITGIALLGLVIFAISAIGQFDAANLTDIAVTDAAGASEWLPFGYLGIWAAIPFAIWFFLAIEGVPLAAEEAANPARNVPRGIIAGIAVLLVTCLTVLVLTPGAGGAAAMSESGNPLVEALGDGTMAEADPVEHIRDRLRQILLAHARHAQRHRDIVEYGPMGNECEILKNHCDIAFFGRNHIYNLFSNKNFPFSYFL
mgnify:CR=1 FL=1